MRIFLDALSKLPTISIGTQALIVGGMEIVAKQFPEVEFVMLTPDIEVEKYYCSQERFKVEFIKRKGGQIQTVLDILEITKSVDGVVSPWGDGYITTPPHKILQKTSFLKWHKKPSVLFPSSIGPFKGKIKTFLAKQGLLKFDALTVRDTITYQYLQSIGLHDVFLLPDTAFAMDPVKREIVVDILKREGVPSGRYVGLNVSQLMNYKCGNEKLYDYSQFIASIADYLVEQFDVTVILVPHQIWPKCAAERGKDVLSSLDGDDRYPIEAIMNKIKKRDRVFPILGEYRPREYKGIIGACEMFVGGRMHSIIGATSQAVPSLLMQYSHKAPGVMETLGLEKYVWDFRSEQMDLYRKIKLLWNNKQNVKNSLSQRLIKIKEDVWKPGEILKELIHKR